MDELVLDYDLSHDFDPELHPFELDARLKHDCIELGDFPLCKLLLMNDATYPWFILVPRRSEVSEVYHLSKADQAQLGEESSFLSENLCDIFAADKMNIAALGNIVRQLHVHHVVRHKDDAAWPAPVWGKQPAQPYRPEQVDSIRQRLDFLMDESAPFKPV